MTQKNTQSKYNSINLNN